MRTQTDMHASTTESKLEQKAAMILGEDTIEQERTEMRQ